jgi:hypothetical protein
LKVNTTWWSRGLEVTADGQGIVWHAGLALLRQLAATARAPGIVLAADCPRTHQSWSFSPTRKKQRGCRYLIGEQPERGCGGERLAVQRGTLAMRGEVKFPEVFSGSHDNRICQVPF